MSRPVVHLHIGSMKTGTTYLQELVLANRDRLAGAGLRFAGASWTSQVRAVQDLLRLDQHDPQIAALSAGAWPALVADLRRRGTSGAVTTLVSMEFLSFARRRDVERLAADLADVELHVVVTVRDAQATIPAQWQTSVTSGSTLRWSHFCEGVRRATGPLWPARALAGDSAVREFRRTQDVGHMLRTWGRVVPAERLHVVLVPGAGGAPTALWDRFAAVLGVDPAVATEPAARSNPSLGHASTELVRRVNLALPEVLPWDYNRTVKAPLGGRVLGARRPEEQRPPLDPATRTFGRAWNERVRRAVHTSGASVSGDLDADLPTTASRLPTGDPAEAEDPGDAEVLDAARTAFEGLTALVERRRRRVARILGARRPEPLPDDPPRWVAATGGGRLELDRAVLDVADLARTAMQLRREVFELRESDEEQDTG